MNVWKWIVTGLLSLMALFHLTAVFLVRGERFELTSPDYYQQELDYQTMIEALRAGKTYDWRYRIDGEGGRFLLALAGADGASVVAGDAEVYLYRPNDAALDCRFELQPVGDGRLSAALPTLAAGRWDLTIQAKVGEQDIAWRERIRLP